MSIVNFTWSNRCSKLMPYRTHVCSICWPKSKSAIAPGTSHDIYIASSETSTQHYRCSMTAITS